MQEGPTDYAGFKSLTANGDVSWDLLDVEGELVNVTAYAPINMAAINDVKPEVVPYLPTTYQETQVLLDVSYWAKHAAEIAERWNAWLSV